MRAAPALRTAARSRPSAPKTARLSTQVRKSDFKSRERVSAPLWLKYQHMSTEAESVCADFYVACQEVIEGSGDVTNAEELASFLEVRGLAET